MHPFTYRELPQGLLPLELTILPQGPSRPKNYKIHDGKILKKIFPSAPSSIQFLKPSETSTFTDLFSKEAQEKKPENILDAQALRTLRLGRTLPYFNSNVRHTIYHLHLPTWGLTVSDGMSFYSYKGLTNSSVKCLNAIFKQAKNVKSVILQPKCEISNFKGLRKARDLQYLSLNIDGNLIMAYPQLFKGLVCLQKVTLDIKALPRETVSFFKFFGFLLSSPRLEHVTIRLEDNFDHYKQLLWMIHEKKLPSFHVIRDNTTNIDFSQSSICWGNCIDSLYLGPREAPEDPNHPFYELSCSENRKILSLKSPVCFQSDLHDLSEGSTTIRNLYIVDFFDSQASPRADMGEPLFKFLSKTKSLEHITMTFETTFRNYSEIMNEFLEKLSQIESLESLRTMTFSLRNKRDVAAKLLPPYGSVMKNLSVLKIRLRCIDLELFYFMEGLKGLENLEVLELDCNDAGLEKKETNCLIPLECLRNLQKISLTFNVRFSEASENNFIERVHKLGNLRVLFLSSRILMGIRSKKAEKLIEDLCRMKSLEDAGFAWNEEEGSKLITVRIAKDAFNGGMKVVSSTLEE